mgnify:CR=1 FL=1
MKKGTKPTLSIFDTFKTKTQELTGEATRQRSIIVALATQVNPAERTRTAISQRIADENGIIWKNIYSGIFRDLDEILIPMNLVREEGRLPLKRGPKALQEKGIPYYELTTRGLLVSLALDEIIGREKILDDFFEKVESDSQFRQSILKLSQIAPKFTFSLFEKYVKAFCDGKISDLLPIDFKNFQVTSDESMLVLREFLKSFSEQSKNDKEAIIEFLERIT